MLFILMCRIGFISLMDKRPPIEGVFRKKWFDSRQMLMTFKIDFSESSQTEARQSEVCSHEKKWMPY
jgi:hypothetical protein